jgi:hypothetical protein
MLVVVFGGGDNGGGWSCCCFVVVAVLVYVEKGRFFTAGVTRVCVCVFVCFASFFCR